MCEAPPVFVALHCALLLLEELVLVLDILGMVFAATCKQSPCELCLAVMPDGSPAFTSEWPFIHGTMSCGSPIPPASVRSSLAKLSLHQGRN